MSLDDARMPGEGRLARWSRRKRGARVADKEPTHDANLAAASETNAVQVAARSPEEGRNSDKAAGGPAKELPSIDTLDKDSDFTPFMDKGVPEELRRLALRKLWSANSTFDVVDPFNVYMDDFTVFEAIDVAKDTIYKVGLGFCEPEDVMTDEEKEIFRRGKASAVGQENVQAQDGGEVADTGSDHAADADSPSAVAGSGDGHDVVEVDSKIADASSRNAESVPIVVSQRKPS